MQRLLLRTLELRTTELQISEFPQSFPDKRRGGLGKIDGPFLPWAGCWAGVLTDFPFRLSFPFPIIPFTMSTFTITVRFAELDAATQEAFNKLICTAASSPTMDWVAALKKCGDDTSEKLRAEMTVEEPLCCESKCAAKGCNTCDNCDEAVCDEHLKHCGDCDASICMDAVCWTRCEDCDKDLCYDCRDEAENDLDGKDTVCTNCRHEREKEEEDE